MPDGVLQWYDPTTGEAAVVRGSHLYRAAPGTVDSSARRAGARVHFDIRRDHGADRAVDVTLRVGTRVSHHQGRFGSLVGARRADTKGSAPFATPHPELGNALASHPLRAAAAWANALAVGDVDDAALLLAPDVVVHDAGSDVTGLDHARSVLDRLPIVGHGAVPQVRGEAEHIVVSWPALGPDRAGVEARLRVEHGQVDELWLGQPPPTRQALVALPAGQLDITFMTRGEVSDDEVGYAQERVGRVAELIDEPILFARVKLTQAADPARTRPALAEATLDINGIPLRAHVAGHTMRETIDLLERRLRDRLQHRGEDREARQRATAVPEPGEWRHADLPTERPDFYDRPVEERRLVRHKTYTVDELTPEEAAYDLEQLDFDFHLYRDLASGQDAVIQRGPGDTYRVTLLHRQAPATTPSSDQYKISEIAAPVLTLQEAIEHLDLGGDHFVFFTDPSNDRGNVLYHRYDGHYGLITAP